jgi:hypothetical protein
MGMGMRPMRDMTHSLRWQGDEGDLKRKRRRGGAPGDYR